MINTVKLQESGYLVNGNMFVPNATSNRYYQAVQEWIAEGNAPEPEFTQAELDQKVIDDNNNQIIQDLEELDKKSIRDIREWIAAQPNTPKMLKDMEAQAVDKRGRLRIKLLEPTSDTDGTVVGAQT